MNGCLADEIGDIDSPRARVQGRPVPKDDRKVAKAQWRPAVPIRDGYLCCAGWAQNQCRPGLLDPFADGFSKDLREIFVIGLEFLVAKRA